MFENFEHKGRWFLPSNTEFQIAGIIRFDVKKGVTLDLIGCFPRGSKTEELIWGFLENGKDITLYNNIEVSRRTSHPGFETVKYISSFLLIGALFTTKRDISFNKVSVHYSHIDEWLSINSGFKKIDTIPQDNRISIDYKLPDPINVQIDANFTLAVNLIVKSPSIETTQKEVTIKQKAFIDFMYKRKVSFDKVLEDTFHFQNFLTLALQRPAYHKEVKAEVKIKGTKRLQAIEIFFHVSHLPEKEIELHPIDMLITYGSISPKFSSVITTWFKNREKLETTTIPFFSVFYNSFLFTSDKFLNLARSMEAFHRDNVRSSVNTRQRLKDIFSKYSKQFNPTLKIKNKTRFIDTIITNRNNFTHSNPILKSKDKPYLHLYYLSEKMQLILTCALLTEIGLSEKEIISSIFHCRLYTHIRRKFK